MTGSKKRQKPRKRPEPAGQASLRWLWVSAAVLLVDQRTKYLIVANMQEYQRIDIWPFFDLVRRHNTGAAFSILADAFTIHTLKFAISLSK